MQSLSALITDGRFAVTTQVAELQKLMIGVKVRGSPARALGAPLTLAPQVWLIGSAVCDVVITLAMITIVRPGPPALFRPRALTRPRAPAARAVPHEDAVEAHGQPDHEADLQHGRDGRDHERRRGRGGDPLHPLLADESAPNAVRPSVCWHLPRADKLTDTLRNSAFMLGKLCVRAALRPLPPVC